MIKVIMMQQRSTEQRSTVDSIRRLTNFKNLMLNETMSDNVETVCLTSVTFKSSPQSVLRIGNLSTVC